MKRVPADEFAEHAAEYLKSDESLEIERDGQVVGRYLPVPHTVNGTATNGHDTNGHDANRDTRNVDPEKHATMEQLRRTLKAIYDETGLTDDEFADLLDPKKPFPYDKAPEA